MNHDVIIPVLISFAISLILGPVVIPFLKKLKMGQTEREEGVQSHLKKAGTPTMGGIIILASVIAVSYTHLVRRALGKMVNLIAEESVDTREKNLAIAHCNCPERAEEVEKMLLSKIEVKSSFIVDTAGISSMYANDGGIIVVI